jgi:hypothetical protein
MQELLSHRNLETQRNNRIMDWINALPGNNSGNTNRSNSRREAVFSMRYVPQLLLCDGMVKTYHSNDCAVIERLFSVGSAPRNYLGDS